MSDLTREISGDKIPEASLRWGVVMHKRGRLWQITFIAGIVYYSLVTIFMVPMGFWIAIGGNLFPLLTLIIAAHVSRDIQVNGMNVNP